MRIDIGRRDAEEADFRADPDAFDGLEWFADRRERAVVAGVGEGALAAVSDVDAEASDGLGDRSGSRFLIVYTKNDPRFLERQGGVPCP